MVDLILSRGGDIVRFAGDAPIVVFRSDRHESSQSLGDLVSRAIQLGLELHETVRAASAANGVALSVRVSVGAGALTATCVGGVNDRRELLVTGDPIAQMSRSQSAASPGDVVLSAEAAALAPGSLRTRMLLDGMTLVLPQEFSVAGSPLTPASQSEALRAFIPRTVLRRIDAGQAEWLAELRPITVLFVRLADEIAQSEGDEARMDAIFRELQVAVSVYGGSVNQFLADDKGTVLLAVWGVPGATHEDDAARALNAALRARRNLAPLRVRVRAGVASGRVFCGWRGNEHRREYAVIGRTVNLAARLMTAGAEGVLCDAGTHAAAEDTVAFSAARTIAVKGIADPVVVHEATGVRERAGDANVERSQELVGRTAERAQIAKAITRLASDGQGGALLIEGEAGMGKSALFTHAVILARTSGVRVALGNGDSVSRSEPYGGLRGILGELFGVSTRADRESRTAQLRENFHDRPDVLERLPLVAGMLGVDIRDTPRTSLMTDVVRADALRDLVVELVQEEAARRAFLIGVDEAHWLDSLSWALLSAIARRAPEVLLLVAGRPATANEAAARTEIATNESATRLMLEGLADADVALLVAQGVGVTSVPDAVLELIARRSGGNPLFVEELTQALVASGIVVVEGARCRLTTDAAQLDAHRFPDTLQGLILTRLDRLTPDEQLTVKVASVIGSSFELMLLTHVHPLAADEDALRAIVGSLARAGLVEPQRSSEDGAFTFKHALMQEVAYDLMATAQRRALHTGVAEWHERATDVPPYALLAHHWVRAANYDRGLECLEGAGRDAYSDGADREAAGFYRTALDVADRERPASVTPLRRVHWRRQLAGAQLRLGENAAGGLTLAQAFGELGAPFPSTKGALTARLAREAVRQLSHSVLPYRVRHPFRRELPARVTELVGLTGLVPQIAYYEGDNLKYMVACLVSVNLAESASSPALAAEAYVALAFVSASLRLRRLADRWWAAAETFGDARVRTDSVITRSLAASTRGDFAESERYARESIVMARAGTNWTGYEKGLWMLLCAQAFTGDLVASEDSAREMLDSATRRNHQQHRVWGMAGIASNRLARGDYVAAREQLADARALLGSVDSATRVLYHATRLNLALGAADSPETLEHATALAALLTGVSGYASAYARISLVRAWLHLGDATREPGERTHYGALARTAVRALRRDVFLVPMAEAGLTFLAGELHWRAGRQPRAIDAWSRALAVADWLGIRQDALNAHERLAEFDTSESGARAFHAREAQLIRTQCGFAGVLPRLASVAQGEST